MWAEPGFLALYWNAKNKISSIIIQTIIHNFNKH